MRKTIATIITAVALAAPMAQAESTPVNVALKYDSTLLATEAGAKRVLESITAQAKAACTSVRPVTKQIYVDRACRDQLVEQASGKIRVAALENGLQPVYVFAALDETSSQ